MDQPKNRMHACTKMGGSPTSRKFATWKVCLGGRKNHAPRANPPIAVTSDAHRISSLDYVAIGIGQARRAWLTNAHVLNTRTWPQIAKLRR